LEILTKDFNQFIEDIIESGISAVWLSTEENVLNKYIEDYKHCVGVIYDVNKNLIIETNSNKYFEITSGYSNAQYAIQINKLNIESISEQKTFYDKPINYSRINQLTNIKVKAVKPEIQTIYTKESLLRSISFYSENKFEFAMIGEDNLRTHDKLDRPMFDGCWLIIKKEILDLNK